MARVVLAPAPPKTGNPAVDAANLAKQEIAIAALGGDIESWQSNVDASSTGGLLGANSLGAAAVNESNAILNAGTAQAGPLQSLLGKLSLPTNLGQAAQAVGVKAPTPTASNPTGGRTILGIPVLDVGIGAAVVGAGLWLFRHKL